MSNRTQLIITILAATLTSSAELTTFTSGSNFYDAINSPVTLETFNSFSSDSSSFGNSSLDVGGMTLTAGYGWVGASRNKIDAPPYVYTSFDIDGTTTLNCYVTQTSDLTINFSEDIHFFGANLANFGTVSTGNFSINNSTSDSTTVPSYAGVSYFGIQSDTPFNQLTISANGNNGFGMDNISYAVPEPASALLLTISCGFILFIRRLFPSI